jgi:hypothetical protein
MTAQSPGADRAAHWSATQIAAALAVGSIAVLIVGTQPIFLGALLDAGQVSLEGVGLVAMGEIVAIGLGVVLGNAALPASRLRLITIAAALAAAGCDGLTLRASGDGPLLAVRAAAGLAEGVLVWGTTGVIVRCAHPARVGGVFFVAQTLAQAALGAIVSRAVIPPLGWQGAFAALAGVALLPCALAWLQPARLAPLAAEERSGLRWSPAMLATLAVIFLQLATLGSLWAYFEPLGKAAGFDAEAAQTLVAGVLAMQVAGGSIASLAVRRLAAVPALLGSSLVLATVTATVHGLPPGSTVSFGSAAAVFGFCWLFLLPFQIGLALRADPSGRLATMVPAAQLLGSAFGPLAASFLVEGDDVGAVPLLSAALAVAAALLLLAGRRLSGPAPGPEP